MGRCQFEGVGLVLVGEWTRFIERGAGVEDGMYQSEREGWSITVMCVSISCSPTQTEKHLPSHSELE